MSLWLLLALIGVAYIVVIGTMLGVAVWGNKWLWTESTTPPITTATLAGSGFGTVKTSLFSIDETKTPPGEDLLDEFTGENGADLTTHVPERGHPWEAYTSLPSLQFLDGTVTGVSAGNRVKLLHDEATNEIAFSCDVIIPSATPCSGTLTLFHETEVAEVRVQVTCDPTTTTSTLTLFLDGVQGATQTNAAFSTFDVASTITGAITLSGAVSVTWDGMTASGNAAGAIPINYLALEANEIAYDRVEVQYVVAPAPPAFVPQYVFDNFTEAGTVPLTSHASDAGPTWTTTTESAIVVASGHVTAADRYASNDVSLSYDMDNVTIAWKCEFDSVDPPTDDGQTTTFSLVSGADGLHMACLEHGDRIELGVYEVIDGARVNLASFSAPSLLPAKTLQGTWTPNGAVSVSLEGVTRTAQTARTPWEHSINAFRMAFSDDTSPQNHRVTRVQVHETLV